MTCIAAAIDKDGTVYMGADRIGSENDRVRILASPKVRLNSGFLIGASGTVRVIQIAHYIFKPPKPTGDLFAFMVKRFTTSLRDCMKEHGGETKDGDDDVMNGGLLIAFKGRLFEIDSSYSVLEVAESYHAIGCAMNEARSAMHARRRSKALSKVRAGLNAAAAFDINIRPPFTIDSIGAKDRATTKATSSKRALRR